MLLVTLFAVLGVEDFAAAAGTPTLPITQTKNTHSGSETASMSDEVTATATISPSEPSRTASFSDDATASVTLSPHKTKTRSKSDDATMSYSYSESPSKMPTKSRTYVYITPTATATLSSASLSHGTASIGTASRTATGSSSRTVSASVGTASVSPSGPTPTIPVPPTPTASSTATATASGSFATVTKTVTAGSVSASSTVSGTLSASVSPGPTGTTSNTVSAGSGTIPPTRSPPPTATFGSFTHTLTKPTSSLTVTRSAQTVSASVSVQTLTRTPGTVSLSVSRGTASQSFTVSLSVSPSAATTTATASFYSPSPSLSVTGSFSSPPTPTATASTTASASGGTVTTTATPSRNTATGTQTVPTGSISLSGSRTGRTVSHSGTGSSTMTYSALTASVSASYSGRSGTRTGPTPSPPPTLTPPITTSLTLSLSATLSFTHPLTSSPTASRTATLSLPITPSATFTSTTTFTPSISASTSLTLTRSVSASGSKSLSFSRSVSSSSSLTMTASVSPSDSASLTVSASVSVSASRSLTFSRSLSPSASPSPSFSHSLSFTTSLSPTFSLSRSFSSTISVTSSLTIPPTRTQTFSSSLTFSRSPTSTESRSGTTSTSATFSGLTLSVSPTWTPSGTVHRVSASNSTTISRSVSDPTRTVSASDSGDMPTESENATVSATITQPPTTTPSLSITKSFPTTSRSLSPSASTSHPTVSASISRSYSGTITSITIPLPPTLSDEITDSHTFSPTVTKSASLTFSSSLTPPPTGSHTPSTTSTATKTASPTYTPSKGTASASFPTPTRSESESGGTKVPTPSTSPSPDSDTTSPSETASRRLTPSDDSVSESVSGATVSRTGTGTRSRSLSDSDESPSPTGSDVVTGSTTVTPPPTGTPSVSASSSDTATVTPPPTGTPSRSSSFSDTFELTDTNNVSSSESLSDPTPSLGSASASNSTEATISESLGALLLIFPRPAVATGARSTVRRQSTDDSGSALSDSYPTLFSNAIRKGIPERERMLVFTVLGDGFATQQQHGVSMFNCLAFETEKAPTFKRALGSVWTSRSLLANTSYLTITFQQDTGFNVGRAEVVGIRFSPFCFMSKRSPVHNTFEFVVAAGGSITDPPAPLVDAATTEASERTATAAVGGTTAIGAPSASALALTKATSLASIAACNGRASTLTFVEHPTGVNFGTVGPGDTDDGSTVTSTSASLFMSAMMMNSVIAVCFALLHAGLVMLKRQHQRRDARDRADRWAREARERGIPPRALHPPPAPPLSEAMASVVFPSRSVVALIFLPMIVKCGVFLFFTVEAPFALGIGFALFAPWVLLFFGGAFVVVGPRFSARYRKTRELEAAAAKEDEADFTFEMATPRRTAGGSGDPPRERTSGAHDLGLDEDDEEAQQRGAWRRRMDDTAEDGPTPAAMGRKPSARTARTPHTASRHLRRSQGRAGRDAGQPPPSKPSVFKALFRPRGEWKDLGVEEAQREAAKARRSQLARELDTSSDGGDDDDSDAPRNPDEAASTMFAAYVAALDPWRRNFVGRFGDLFGDFHGKAHYFLLVDALVAVVAGGLDGYAAASGSCFSLAIALLVLFSIYLLFLLVKRPFTVVANNVFFVIVAAVQVGLAILAVLYLYSDKGDQSALKSLVTLSVVLQFFLIARALVDVVALAYLSFTGHRERKEKTRREEQRAITEAIAAYYAGQDAQARREKSKLAYSEPLNNDGPPTPDRRHPATMPLSPPPTQPQFDAVASPELRASQRLQGDPTMVPWGAPDGAHDDQFAPVLPQRERFADVQPTLRLPDAEALRDELSWRRPDAAPSPFVDRLPVPGPEGETAGNDDQRPQPSVPQNPWSEPGQPRQPSRQGLRPPEWDTDEGTGGARGARGLSAELQNGLQRGGSSGQQPFQTPVGRRVQSAIARAPHHGPSEMDVLMDALDEFDAEADAALGPSPSPRQPAVVGSAGAAGEAPWSAPRPQPQPQRQWADESDLDDLL